MTGFCDQAVTGHKISPQNKLRRILALYVPRVGVNSIPELELQFNSNSNSGIGIEIGIEIGGIENGIGIEIPRVGIGIENRNWIFFNCYHSTY